MYVTETELSIREGFTERFLVATKVYRAATRAEPGNLRCDLLRLSSAPYGYVLVEAFRDANGYDIHRHEEHSRAFARTIAELSLSAPEMRHLRSVMSDAGPPTPPSQRSSSQWETFANARFRAGAITDPLASLRVALTRLEVSAATEGALRGLPDPAIILAAYGFDGDAAFLSGRLLFRAKLTADAPCVVKPKEAALELPFVTRTFPARMLFVMVGIEENAGRGVQRAYQELQATACLMLSNAGAGEPVPEPLHEYCRSAGAEPYGSGVVVISDGVALSELMDDDTWVGATANVCELRADRRSDVLRFRMNHQAEKNDWSATVTLNLTVDIGS